MSRYSEAEKQNVKKFIMDKLSKTLDDALIRLESAYEYDAFRNEIWIDGFDGSFKLHFIPANELNGGQNFTIFFEHRKGDKY